MRCNSGSEDNGPRLMSTYSITHKPLGLIEPAGWPDKQRPEAKRTGSQLFWRAQEALKISYGFAEPLAGSALGGS
jgi:hypothetical protein